MAVHPRTISATVPRNSTYGPHYADVDLSVFKDLVRKAKVQFQIAAQAYNALNHVNFGTPQSNASNPATLGIYNNDIVRRQVPMAL